MATQQAAATDTAPPTFTRLKYHWLIEAGILTAEDKVELIDGEITNMAPVGDEHSDKVRYLNLWLARQAREAYIHQCQIPVRLAEGFTPEPDFALLRYQEHEYRHGNNPAVADVLQVIEVAESDLEYNLGEKAQAYVRAGVPELWVVDIPHRRVHVLINPGPDGYQAHATAEETESVTALLIPGLTCPVAEVL